MSFTNIKSTQNAFLETYLRGTDRSLTEDQARALFNVQNLRARMTELRAAGLNIRLIPTKTTSKTAYKVSRRDVFGGQYKMFS